MHVDEVEVVDSVPSSTSLCVYMMQNYATRSHGRIQVQDSTLVGYIPSLPFLSPHFPLPSSSFPSPPTARTPLIAARSEERGGAWTPNVFWCILGINLHHFECLNDEEFPVSCSPLKMWEQLVTLAVFSLGLVFYA